MTFYKWKYLFFSVNLQIMNFGSRAQALLFNRRRPKGLRVVTRAEFYAGSEYPFPTNGRWWVMGKIGICVWFWHFFVCLFAQWVFFQISVRSWQVWYQIKALNRRSLFICSFSSFSGCHGNGSQQFAFWSFSKDCTSEPKYFDHIKLAWIDQVKSKYVLIKPTLAHGWLPQHLFALAIQNNQLTCCQCKSNCFCSVSIDIDRNTH